MMTEYRTVLMLVQYIPVEFWLEIIIIYSIEMTYYAFLSSLRLHNYYAVKLLQGDFEILIIYLHCLDQEEFVCSSSLV